MQSIWQRMQQKELSMRLHSKGILYKICLERRARTIRIRSNLPQVSTISFREFAPVLSNFAISGLFLCGAKYSILGGGFLIYVNNKRFTPLRSQRLLYLNMRSTRAGWQRIRGTVIRVKGFELFVLPFTQAHVICQYI